MGSIFSLVAISDDDGKTWHPSLPIAGRGNVQPDEIDRQDDTIFQW